MKLAPAHMAIKKKHQPTQSNVETESFVNKHFWNVSQHIAERWE